jgi:hypothetical protein
MRDTKDANASTRIVIDPVETGFPGAGMSRETQFFISAGEICNRRFLMEVTPPEDVTGFA